MKTRLAPDRVRYRLIDLGDDGKRRRVKVVMRGRFEGFVVRWTDSCSGCCEAGDYGGNLRHYGYDNKAGCHVGSGCEECGYRGKVRRAEWVSFPDVIEAYHAWRDRVWKRHERLSRVWRNRSAA